MTQIGYNKENDIDIKDIVLRSKLGSRFSLMGQSNLFEELHILETINGQIISGEILLQDGANFIGEFPVLGMEYLDVTFRTPLEDVAYITHTFYVYATTPRARTKPEQGGEQEKYALLFCSPELVENDHLKCRKSYKGTPSEIISKIMMDNFPKKIVPPIKFGDVSRVIDTELNSEMSENYMKFVSPMWSPMRCINWLVQRAVSLSSSWSTKDRVEHHRAGNPDFIFYQTLSESGGKYNLVSLSSLNEKESVREYHLSKGTGTINNQSIKSLLGFHFTVIQDYLNIKYADKWEGIQQGVFASRLYTHDITHKIFDDSNNYYNYKTDFHSTNHINRNKILPSVNENLSSKQDTVIHYKPKQDYIYTDEGTETSVSADKQFDRVIGREIDNFKIEEWFLSRKSLTNQLYSQTNKILVSGDSTIHVGDIVTLNIPTVASHLPEGEGLVYDKNVGGRFLITAIKHIIRAEGPEHKMWLELSRDSLETSIPDSADFLGINSAAKLYQESSPPPTSTTVPRQNTTGLPPVRYVP